MDLLSATVASTNQDRSAAIVGAARRNILHRMTSQGMGFDELSARAGYRSPVLLVRRLTGSVTLTLSDIVRIAEALDCPTAELLDDEAAA